MNTFGTLFKIAIYGESHGAEVGVVIDGCPAGVPLNWDLIQEDLKRRMPGAKGTTGRIEADEPIVRSGFYNGFTTGSPLSIAFVNANTRSEAYTSQRHYFRPGHADFTAHKKYKGFEDFRGGGHFSGRLTVGLVAAGAIAKQILTHILGDKAPKITATIQEVAGIPDVEKGILKAIEAGDTVGGIIEVVAQNVPLGLGEPFFDACESKLSHIVFAIPGIKGIEFGAGFSAAKMFGSEHNDAFMNDQGLTSTNHAGGINGGITNGNPLVFRVAVKPTASTPATQITYHHIEGKMQPTSVKGRHDLCIALRVPVILEAVTAMVLLDLYYLSQKSI